jgi:hypothetical protein
MHMLIKSPPIAFEENENRYSKDGFEADYQQEVLDDEIFDLTKIDLETLQQFSRSTIQLPKKPAKPKKKHKKPSKVAQDMKRMLDEGIASP